MEYIRIKGLEKPISKLIMGSAWMTLEDEPTGHALFDAYFEAGGNVLDTGRFYGRGSGIAKSERIVGNWLKKSGVKRADIHIIDKAGHPFITKDGVTHWERSRISPEFITDDLMYSLDHVGVDYFDIYELHRDNPKVPVADLMDRLEYHCLLGQIKAYGVSNWRLDRIQEAIDYCNHMGYQGLSCNNPSYSLATVKVARFPGGVYADDAYASKHKEWDLPIISWGSQGAGFFAGIYPRDGHGVNGGIIQAYFSEENFKKLDRCNELGAKKGVDPINLALAYILNQDFEVAAVIGPQNVKELNSSLVGASLKLTPKEVAYLGLKSDTYE